MRALLIASLMSLAFSVTASAQMCGGSSGQTAQSSGMSCMGGQKEQTQAIDTFGQPAAKAAGMGCACCRNMAMMGGMKHEDQKDQQQHEPAPKH